MGSSENTALNLVGMVYDAALDQSKWPTFLEAFALTVSGHSAILRSADLQTQQAGFVASVGYDPAWQAAYCNHFVKVDFLTPAMNQMELGEVKTSGQVFSPSEQRKTEIYNDYFLPQDKVDAMGVMLTKDGSHTLLFAAQRGKRAGAFGEEQMRMMGILAPHVTRAVQVHRKLSNAHVEKEWALGALDQLRMGVILTNGAGAPLFVNSAAEQMLSARQGIDTRQGQLALSKAAETARLHQLVADAAQGAPGANRGGDMRIALPDGESLHCMVMPVPLELSARLDVALASGCVAIFLSRPSGLQLPPQRLATLYALTPAEARLAAKLAALRSVEQAADELCVTLHTARSQLKSIFAKTGAQSQSELLMLLATGTLASCRDDVGGKNNPGKRS
jgi:DNA-binding CsgD family transcriptional regulator